MTDEDGQLPEHLNPYRVYRVLVEECGANPDDHVRWQFANYLYATRSEKRHWFEWRFEGSLNSGGKVKFDGSRVYVDCYNNDLTPEREIAIKKANDRLELLFAEAISDHPQISAPHASLIVPESEQKAE